MNENSNSYPGSARDDKFLDYQSSSRSDDESVQDEEVKGENEENNKGKKKYSVISQAVREKFIERVLSKEVTIKEAAKEFDLKFSTSKAILQTYKKEGRIGKKKNRERKTKILNVVFLCNVNQLNPSSSKIFPIVSDNDTKGFKTMASAEVNKNKLVEQTLQKYPEHKIVHQTHSKIPHDSNKSTQQYLKDLGNDFLKDFIEKNFNGNKMQQLGGNMDPHAYSNNPTGPPSSVTMSHLNNAPSNLPPHSFPGMQNMTNGPMVVPQQAFSLGINLPQITDISQFNQFNSHHNMHSLNQKRNFHQYEKEMMQDFDTRNEMPMGDISVKKFKSGEDALWDDDLDTSKRDLEDFIYKTHHAMMNNTFVGKTSTLDFSKYKDEFNE